MHFYLPKMLWNFVCINKGDIRLIDITWWRHLSVVNETSLFWIIIRVVIMSSVKCIQGQPVLKGHFEKQWGTIFSANYSSLYVLGKVNKEIIKCPKASFDNIWKWSC